MNIMNRNVTSWGENTKDWSPVVKTGGSRNNEPHTQFANCIKFANGDISCPCLVSDGINGIIMSVALNPVALVILYNIIVP